ncbi:hypothetical protein [Weissella minor]|uniref:hypothetical protein n=1 Tax=Weissella minor TaxID=1620 RepID=UPI003AF2502F
MEEIKNIPVEIYQVKGTVLYQIAYIGKGRYFLYKCYSPWKGFLNCIPYVTVKRDAQIISEDIAIDYIYKKNYQGKKFERTGWSLIVSNILPTIISGGVASLLSNNLIYLFIIIMGIFFIGIKIQYKRLQTRHNLIKKYVPNVSICLKNNTFFGGGRFAMVLFVMVVLIWTLTLRDSFGRILTIFLMSLIPFMAYDFYPDDEELKYTENRIDVIIDPNQKRSKLDGKLMQ